MWQFRQPSQCFSLKPRKISLKGPMKIYSFTAKNIESQTIKKMNIHTKEANHTSKTQTTSETQKPFHHCIAASPFPFTVCLSSVFRQSQALCSYFNYNKSLTRFQIPNYFQIQNPNLIPLTDLTWTVASSLTISLEIHSLEPYSLISVVSLVKDETQISIPNCRILNLVKRKYSLSFPLSPTETQVLILKLFLCS
jgi:hypothetical protein